LQVKTPLIATRDETKGIGGSMKLPVLVASAFVLFLICGVSVHPIFVTLSVLLLGGYFIYCLIGFFVNLIKNKK